MMCICKIYIRYIGEQVYKICVHVYYMHVCELYIGIHTCNIYTHIYIQ